MKNLIAIGLAIALVVDVALFLGIGIGSAALAVTAAPHGFVYVSNPYTVGNSMQFAIDITSWTSSQQIPATALIPGQQSTVISFGMYVTDPSGDNCGNTGQPTWEPNTPADWGSWSISLQDHAAIVVDTNGQQYASTTNLWLTENASNTLFYCANFGTGDIVSPSLTNGQLYFAESITLVGQYAPTELNVDFFGFGTFCDGYANPFGGGTAVCSNAANAATNGQHGSNGPQGGFGIVSQSLISLYSGYASVTVDNPGQLAYNGGTLTVSASTGYDPASGGGQGSYTLAVYYPQARGGGIDSAFSAQQVPSLDPNFGYTWMVPLGTSANSTTAGWNNFLVELTANYYFQGGATAGIDISPLYAPTTPVISVSNNGPFLTQPQIGNTVTITVTAQPAGNSGPVTSITLWVYYLQSGQSPSQLPGCGNAWVPGISCPGGTNEPTTTSGNIATVTFSFVVASATGYNQIGVQAQASNGQSQISQISTYLINIAPTGLQCGQQGAPVCSTGTFWEEIGPYLLVIAFVLAAALIAMFVPIPYIRWGLPIAVIALAVILLAFNIIQPLFQPGSIFNVA